MKKINKSVRNSLIAVAVLIFAVIFFLLAQNETFTGEAYNFKLAERDYKVNTQEKPLKIDEKLDLKIDEENPPIGDPNLPELNASTFLIGSCSTNGIPITQRDIDNAITRRIPFTISQQGYYCLTEDITSTSYAPVIDLIDIQVPAVFDLNGHTISSLTSPNSIASVTRVAIKISSNNVRITNGRIYQFSQAILGNPYINDLRYISIDNLMVSGVNNAIKSVNTIRDLIIEKNEFYSLTVNEGFAGSILTLVRIKDLKDSIIRENELNGGTDDSVIIAFNSTDNVEIFNNQLNEYGVSGIEIDAAHNTNIFSNRFYPRLTRSPYFLRAGININYEAVDLFISKNSFFRGAKFAQSYGIHLGDQYYFYQSRLTNRISNFNIEISDNDFKQLNSAVYLYENSNSYGTVKDNKGCNLNYGGIEEFPTSVNNNLVEINNNWNLVC